MWRAVVVMEIQKLVKSRLFTEEWGKRREREEVTEVDTKDRRKDEG